MPSPLQVSTAREIISHFDGEYAQLVVCDGAPDGEYSLLVWRTYLTTENCVK